tara:strand:+ start:139 stop:510 length:372 start_codon:yes stop_codon:yes gene_type:complete
METLSLLLYQRLRVTLIILSIIISVVGAFSPLFGIRARISGIKIPNSVKWVYFSLVSISFILFMFLSGVYTWKKVKLIRNIRIHHRKNSGKNAKNRDRFFKEHVNALDLKLAGNKDRLGLELH